MMLALLGLKEFCDRKLFLQNLAHLLQWFSIMKKTVFPYSDLLRKTVKFRSQKMQFLYLDAQKELDAHLFTIGSPNEYYN